ncbi:hypothetical protein [Dactylosporangium sp. NPDC000521]
MAQTDHAGRAPDRVRVAAGAPGQQFDQAVRGTSAGDGQGVLRHSA